MSSVIKRDKFDFYGNTMTVQLIQDIYNGEQVTYSAIKFYNKQLNVMPTWHPWFGPAFVSIDDYALAGIKPLIIPSELALEYGQTATLLEIKDFFNRVFEETEIEITDGSWLSNPQETFYIHHELLYDDEEPVRIDVDLSQYLLIKIVKEPFMKGVDILRYVPVNNIFANTRVMRVINGQLIGDIYIPKDIIPARMAFTAKNIYGLIAQQHRENYDKYVGSVFREIAEQSKTGIARVPWVNTNYKAPMIYTQHVEEIPSRAITIQDIQLTRYGIVRSIER